MVDTYAPSCGWHDHMSVMHLGGAHEVGVCGQARLRSLKEDVDFLPMFSTLNLQKYENLGHHVLMGFGVAWAWSIVCGAKCLHKNLLHQKEK